MSNFVCRIVRQDLLKEAHKRLITIIKLIEQKYGAEKISLNLHLSLYLYKCAYDYGPLYIFWCFSFEKMNGILGKFLLNYIGFVTLTVLLTLNFAHRSICTLVPSCVPIYPCMLLNSRIIFVTLY